MPGARADGPVTTHGNERLCPGFKPRPKAAGFEVPSLDRSTISREDATERLRYLRRRAEECRAQAETMRDAEARRSMLLVASGYERLAEGAAAMVIHQIPPERQTR